MRPPTTSPPALPGTGRTPWSGPYHPSGRSSIPTARACSSAARQAAALLLMPLTLVRSIPVWP